MNTPPHDLDPGEVVDLTPTAWRPPAGLTRVVPMTAPSAAPAGRTFAVPDADTTQVIAALPAKALPPASRPRTHRRPRPVWKTAALTVALVVTVASWLAGVSVAVALVLALWWPPLPFVAGAAAALVVLGAVGVSRWALGVLDGVPQSRRKGRR